MRINKLTVRINSLLLLGSLFFMHMSASMEEGSIKLVCNGEAIEVREQNDVPLSYGLNTYKYARLTYNGEALQVEIQVSGFSFDDKDWDISPHSYGIKGSKKGNKLSFAVDRTGYLVVRFSKDQDFTKRLVILIEPPELVPEGELVNIVEAYQVDSTGASNQTRRIQRALDDISASGKILYFPDGLYKTFALQIRSHSRIHLSKNARILADRSNIDSYLASDGVGVNRFISILDARDIHVSGLGCLDGNGSAILGMNDKATVERLGGMRLLFIRNSKDVHFEGILLKDAARWNTHILGCEDISFRYCKLMNSLINNQYFGSLDGWDPDASRGVLIEDCFGWAGDDNVAIKCTGLGDTPIHKDVYDITVRRCVFLTKKTALKIGTETRCDTMSRIVFEDNDIIEADRVMGINVRDRATVKDVYFKNNRSEYVYPDRRQMGINMYITRREDDQIRTGKIQNVVIEDCSFEKKFPNAIQVHRIASHTLEKDLQVTFKNLQIAGKKIESLEAEYFELSRCNGQIHFKTGPAKSPNIIFILTDDQGWTHRSHRADPAVPESSSDYYETPRIDQLASSGILFTQGYAPNPICSPTRHSILFGQNAARHIYNKDTDWYKKTGDWLTIPKVLKQANPEYRTAHFGKWHIAMLPGEAGYDHSDGMTSNNEGEIFGEGTLNARDYTRQVNRFLREKNVPNPSHATIAGKPSAYWSDRNPKGITDLTNRACSFMEACVEEGKPFFIQLSHYATHLSLVSQKETYEYFLSKSSGEKHTNPEFAAMLKDLDSGIGNILDKVKEQGIEENTYIFLMGDNGGRLSLNQIAVIGEDGELLEARYSTQHERNLPLRDGKHSFYEGGIRVPFIVAGPGIRTGRICEIPVSGLDLLPTFADLAGYQKELPESLDGGSMVPLLLNEAREKVDRRSEYLIFHQALHRKPRSAIRKGDYKLVKYWSKESKYEHSPKVELFHIAEDLGETRDLAEKHPELTSDLEKELNRFLMEVNAETEQLNIEGPFYRLLDDLERGDRR